MNKVSESLGCLGVFTAVCHDRYGNEKWRDVFRNTVMTAGKNHMLDNYLAGSSFTQVGPFMGLISSSSYSAISAADTAASHAGWLEAGTTNAPTYSARITCVANWAAAAAGSKALTAANAFTMTGAGTAKGAFMILGSGAVVTNLNTSGTLFSAGLFSGGDKVVVSTDVVNVSWSLAL